MIDKYISLIDRARQAVPAVDYALGVAGVAAAAGIIIIIIGYERVGIILLSGIFLSMLLLFVFSRVASSSSSHINNAGIVLIWSSIFFFVSFLMFTISAFSFQWPRHWANFIGIEAIEEPESASYNYKTLIKKYSADQKRIVNSISAWYCSVLSQKIDFSKALSEFKLEQMPPYEESIQESTHPDAINYEAVSTGHNYIITYSYRYKKDKPDKKYGFDLTVQETGALPETVMDAPEKKELWLSRFGKAEDEDLIEGRQVKSDNRLPWNKNMATFTFSSWNSSNEFRANWFDENYAFHSKKLCSSYDPL